MRLLSRSLLTWMVLLALALLALLNVGRMVLGGLTDPRWAGFDLHAYWYYAHFVWEGVNPYRAFAQRLTPTLPLTYWDGVTVSSALPTAEVLGNTPANTAPLLLLIAPLARLSWPLARVVWLLFNLALLPLIGWLAWRALDPARRWPEPVGLLAVLLPPASAPALAGVIYGQTTQLVSAALLGSYVLRARRPWLAGLLFGLALSKYSLGIALLPLLLLERRWRVLATALGVQAAALLFVAALDGSSVLSMLRVYALLAGLHVETGGIHLASFSAARPVVIALGVLVTALFGLYVWWRRAWRDAPALLAAGAVWSLLAVYHLHYDLLLACVPALFVASRAWNRGRLLALAGWLPAPGLCVPVLLVPALAEWGATALLLALFGLLFLLPANGPEQPAGAAQ